MQTYLVTGATGFVGFALASRLRQRGQPVRALVRDDGGITGARALRRPQLEALGCEPLHASLGDPNALAPLCEGVEVLFHCAGEGSHRADARALSWINVAGTENVINAARHAGVKRVVHLSCADATLTTRDRLNVREDQARAEAPLDACSESLLLAEEIALQASRGSFEVTAVRPSWVWGPGDLHKLPLLCAEALRGRISLCGSGDNLVSTAYVENVVDVLVQVASSARAPGRCYHVTDGEALTAREFLALLSTSVGLPAPRRGVFALSYAAAYARERLHLPGHARADVVLRGCASLFDTSAVIRDLGYRPRTSVEDGMRALAEWVRAQGGPAALAKLARSPAGRADADAFEALARAKA